MKYSEKYLKYNNLSLENCNFYNNIMVGGAMFGKFIPGDKIITKSGFSGTIVRQANWNEFGMSLDHSKIYYIVIFPDNTTRHSDAINVVNATSGGYDYIIEENNMSMLVTSSFAPTAPPLYSSPTLTPVRSVFTAPFSCKFSIGETVYFVGGTVREKKTLTHVTMLASVGLITNIIQTPYSTPPNKCLYELAFNSGIECIEITDEMLRKYDASTGRISESSEFFINGEYVRKQIDKEDNRILKKRGKEFRDEIASILEKKNEDKKNDNNITFIKTKSGLKKIMKYLKKFAKKKDITWHRLNDKKHMNVATDYVMKKLKF